MLIRICVCFLLLFWQIKAFSTENVIEEEKKELIFELLEPEALYPAFNAVPLCRGKIRLTNKLGTNIRKLEISFVFKGVSMPFSFTSVADHAVLTRPLAMIGTGCTGLFETPKLNIKACEVEKEGIICEQFVRYYLGEKGQEK